MKFIEDFKEDERIIDHYLCKQKQNLKSRAGKAYLSLRLQDKTGQIDAKVWEVNSDIQGFDENDYIKVDGVVLTYQNELQLRVTRIRRSEPFEIDPLNYIPCTDKDIDDMYKQITDYIASISNKYVRALMEAIVVRDEYVAKAFRSHSAAKNMHHSYMGGLIEHTVSVTEICDFMCLHYTFLNRDILIASAILHDIGKVYELSPFPENDYTDDGQMLGHLVVGAEMIEKAASGIENFPHQLKSMIKHCVLSHHGEYEFGSPKLPKTAEAIMLHYADNIDAKTKIFEEAAESQNVWTGYNRMLQRNIRKSVFDS